MSEENKNENYGNLLLGLKTFSKGQRKLAEDLFTIIQAAFLGKYSEYDAAALLKHVLPPGRDIMYNGGYCPPFDENIFALLDGLFDFSLAEESGGDYKDVKIIRRSDGKSIILTLKVPFDFSEYEYQNRLERCKYKLEEAKKCQLERLYREKWPLPEDRMLATYLGINIEE
mgnify:CR=1 FL=1